MDHGLCLCLCPSEDGEEGQPSVEPNEVEDAYIVDSHLATALSLFLFLYLSEEGEEVQPAVGPNEQEDVDTVEQ